MASNSLHNQWLLTMGVKNYYAHITIQRILNKYIKINFSRFMFWLCCCLFQDGLPLKILMTYLQKMNKILSKIWTKQLRSNFRKNFVHFLEGIKVRRFGFDISWPFNKHQKNAWFKWESNYVPKLILQKIDHQGFLLVCSHSKFLSTTTFRNSQETFFGRMLMFWWQECAVTCCCIYHNFKSFKWGLFDLIVKIKILS